MTLFKCVKCKLAAQCETKSQGIFFSLSLFNALHSVWRKDIKNVLSSQVICSDRKKICIWHTTTYKYTYIKIFSCSFSSEVSFDLLAPNWKRYCDILLGKTIELSIGTYRPFIVQIHKFTFFVKTTTEVIIYQ